MRLESTIAELDRKAEEYKTAADALRNLLKYEGADNTGSSAASSSASDSSANQKSKATSSKSKNTGNGSSGVGNKGKRTVSPETRAKIAAATKARHAAKKQAEV